MAETLDPMLRTAIEALPQPAWLADRQGRQATGNRHLSAGGAGHVPDPAGRGWADLVHEDDRGVVLRRWAEALERGEAFEAEARLGGAEHAPWALIRAVPLRNEAGAIIAWLGTFTDIDARKSLDETRQALAREMNHRVKNLFAVANGLVSLTARSAKTPKDMADALRGRLGALSRAHELMRTSTGAEHGSQGARLDGLVRALLAPYAQEGERLTIAGPAVPVGSGTVTNLALVLHELATNTAKYGSLSRPDGRLAVAWTQESEEVRLAWEESGGPDVVGEPASEGFGGQLARRTISGQLGGEIAYDWRPRGLRLTMVLPLDRLSR